MIFWNYIKHSIPIKKWILKEKSIQITATDTETVMSLFSSNTDTKMKLIPGITLWGKKKKEKKNVLFNLFTKLNILFFLYNSHFFISIYTQTWKKEQQL